MISRTEDMREACLLMRARIDDMDKQLDAADALLKHVSPDARETLRSVTEEQRARTRYMREQNEKQLKVIETLIALDRRGGLNPGGSA